MTLFARHVAPALFVSACCAPSASAAGEVQYRTVAVTGQTAPGAGGKPYVGFERPSIDGTGRIVFGGRYDPGTFPYRGGMWVDVAGQKQLVGLEGDAAPGGTFTGFHYANPQAGGSIVFGAFLENQVYGQFIAAPNGSLTRLIANGDPAPGMPPGAVFGGVPTYSPTFGGGVHAFDGYVTGGGTTDGDHEGLWAGTPGDIRLLARARHQAPGAPAGVVFTYNPSVSGPALGPPRVDRLGNVTFHGNLSGEGVDHFNDDGIWHGTKDGVRMVVRSGNAAPDSGGGVFLSTGMQIGAANGRIAFNAGITPKGFVFGGPVVQSGDPVPTPEPAIYAGPPDALRLIARATDIAPGTEQQYRNFLGFAMNAAGDVVFNGGPGLFVSRGGVVSPVMTEGMRAPGTPEGVLFNNPLFASINNLGQIAFDAHVQGPDVEDFDTRGIWVTDGGGSLHLIAREGELFDVGDGDLRLIDDLEMWTYTNAGEDGTPTAFNDLGQLAFRAMFKDGTEGVFVATVPEPGAALAIMLTVPALFRRRRRR